MAKQFPRLEPAHREFIQRQRVFFTASAAPTGHVTSCGYGVPLYEYEGERPTLTKWAEAKGPEGLDAYRRQKNTHSLDGLPTGLFDEGA